MKFKLVRTKNVQQLHAALSELRTRNRAVPGLGLLFGRTGAGKTTALASAVGMFDAIFVRSSAVITMSSLLDLICFELSIEPPTIRARRYKAICESLTERPRPIFVDEADYLTRDGRMLEVLRDIHDAANVPVILIGMDSMEHKLAKHPQFARRISQRIEFRPCDMADTALVFKELCEVDVANDLLEWVDAPKMQTSEAPPPKGIKDSKGQPTPPQNATSVKRDDTGGYVVDGKRAGTKQ